MSDQDRQGRKANDNGDAARATVREHLLTQARLHGCGAKTLRAFGEGHSLYPGTGEFAQNVLVQEDGAFARPFTAHFVVSHRDWPHDLLLFVHSQNTGGTAENSILRFLFDLFGHKRTPGVIVLIGDYWEQHAAAQRVEWVRRWTRSKDKPYLLRVFVGLAEFRTWINEGLPWPEVRQRSFA